MKKLYAIFALAGLVAVNNTNAMLPGLGGLRHASRSFVQPAREALLRSGKPIITPGTFTPSRLPQGQTLGLGQRGLTTTTRQSIFQPSTIIKPKQLLQRRTFSSSTPQQQTQQAGYLQMLRNTPWVQQFTNALRQDPQLMRRILTGPGIAGAGALSQVGPLLAEEEIKKDPAYQNYVHDEYAKLIQQIEKDYGVKPGRIKDPEIIANYILARKVDTTREPEAIYADLFKLLQSQSKAPITGWFLNEIYTGKVINPVVHERLISLIENGTIDPAKLLDRPIQGDRMSPEIVELLKYLKEKDPEIYLHSELKNTTMQEIQRLENVITEFKEIKKKLSPYNLWDAESSIQEKQDQINFQKTLLGIIDPPSVGNLFGWWR